MAIDWNEPDEEVLATAIREAGVESDLDDTALISKARAAQAEIAKRVGPRTGLLATPGPGSRYVFLNPPAGTIVSVKEGGVALVEGTDYRIRGGGTYLERLSGGYSRLWDGPIEVEYSAVDFDDRYDRVVIDLVKLAIEYGGLDSRRDGDYSEEAAGARGGGLNSYQMQREQILSELVDVGVGFA